MGQIDRTVLFVTPPYHCGVVEVAGTWPPLGLAFLAAQAEAAGWNAKILDAMSLGYSLRDLETVIRGESYDLLATTAITPTLPDAVEVCRIAKRAEKSVTTLLGGVHPTFCATEILSDDSNSVDYIVAGEGEGAFFEFLKNFDDLDKRHGSPNLRWLEDGGVRSNPSLPFHDDLDKLPVAWHLLDWSLYRYHVIPNSRLAAVATSRGCDHECTFCSQQKFWEKTWRGRRPESVVSEIRRIHENYGANVVLFTDEFPTKDRQRWEELLDRIINEKLDIHLLMETRVEDIIRDRDILDKYRKAGVIHIYVGAEATDQSTLNRINKEIVVDQSRQAIDLIAGHGMISETSFVLGFPEETQETIEATLRTAREFNPDFAHFLALTPWPYAPIFAEVEEMIEEHDFRKYNLIEPIIRPLEMTRTQVDCAIIDCYRRFYMPKVKEYSQERDEFRREYLLRSMRLIMQSSFLIEKFAKLGLKAPKMIRDRLKF